MNWPNKEFHNGVRHVGENIHFGPESTLDFQGDLPGWKTDMCRITTDFWHPQGALTGPQGHISPILYQESRRLYDDSTAFQDELEPLVHHHIAGHPQMEENRRFSDGTENPISVLDQVPELTPNNIGSHEPWLNFQQQDKWAMPNCRTPYSPPQDWFEINPSIYEFEEVDMLQVGLWEDLPPVPALVHLEPRTGPQPRYETNANPKPRKCPTVKPGSVRINASKSQNKRPRPGPEVRIFKSINMKELSKRPRYLSPAQRKRAAVVRKVGACTPCRSGHRACQHAAEEPSSPGTNDPVTPNGNVPMDISVYSPTETGLQYQ